jgi:hypothetical protein
VFLFLNPELNEKVEARLLVTRASRLSPILDPSKYQKPFTLKI